MAWISAGVLVNAATIEQSSGIDQINLAVAQMDSVTQQNALLVQQAGKSVAVAGNIGPTLLDTLGQRLDATGPVRVSLVGPGHHDTAPAGRVIRAPGNDVWLLARWIVDGPADLPQAHAMQAGLQVVAPVPNASGTPRVEPTASTDPANFLAVVNELLGRNPAPEHERNLLAQWSALGLRAGDTNAWASLDQPLRDAWTSRIGPAHGALPKGSMRSRRMVQGWGLSPLQLGNYGDQYALRAGVALGLGFGLGARGRADGDEYQGGKEQAAHRRGDRAERRKSARGRQ